MSIRKMLREGLFGLAVRYESFRVSLIIIDDPYHYTVQVEMLYINLSLCHNNNVMGGFSPIDRDD
jgi:hypothetical protein